MAYYDFEQRSTRPKAMDPVYTTPDKGFYKTSTGETKTFDNVLARKNLSTRMKAEDQRRSDIYQGEQAIEEGRQHIATMELEHEKALREYQGALARGVDDGIKRKKADDLFSKINKAKEWYAGWDSQQKKLAELTAQVAAEEGGWKSSVEADKKARREQAEAEAKRKHESGMKKDELESGERKAGIEARAKLIAERQKNQSEINILKTTDPNSLDYAENMEKAAKLTRRNKDIGGELNALGTVNSMESVATDDQGRPAPAIMRSGDPRSEVETLPFTGENKEPIPLTANNKPIKRTGIIDGRKVAMFEDGTVDYIDGTESAPTGKKGESVKTEGKVTKPDNRYTVGELFGEVFQKPNADVIQRDLRRELGIKDSNKEPIADIEVNSETLRNMLARALKEGKNTANLYKDIYMAFLGQPSSDLFNDIGNMKLPIEKEG